MPNIVPKIAEAGQLGRLNRRWADLHTKLAHIDAVVLGEAPETPQANHLYLKGNILMLGDNQVALQGDVTALTALINAFFEENNGQGVSSILSSFNADYDTLKELIAGLEAVQGGSATELDGLTDVTITASSLSAGQVLRYSGSTWTNSALDYADLINKPTYITQQEADSAYAPAGDYATAASLTDLQETVNALPAPFSGEYGELTGAPTLFDGAYSSLTGAPTLFDGAYSSLTGAPTLFDGAYSSLTGAPTLSSVATSGNYADLTGAPTLFDGSYASLTGAPTITGTVSAGTVSNINIADGSGGFSATNWNITAASTMTMAGHILPSADATYDLGSAEAKVRHLFLSDNSLHIGDSTVSYDGTDGSIIGSFTKVYGVSSLEGESLVTLGEQGSLLQALKDGTAWEAPRVIDGKTYTISGLSGDSTYWAGIDLVESFYAHGDKQVQVTLSSVLNQRLSLTASGPLELTGSYPNQSLSIAEGTYAPAGDYATAASLTDVKATVDGRLNITAIDSTLGITNAGTLSAVSFDDGHLATAASLTDVRTTVNSRLDITSIGTGLTLSGGTISAETSGFLTSGDLNGYQPTLTVSDSSEIGINSNVLSLNAFSPYEPGKYGNIPVDGSKVSVSPVTGGAGLRDGALMPRYTVLDNVMQSTTSAYTRTAESIIATHNQIEFADSPQKIVSVPNTSMYFVSILGNQSSEADKGQDWVHGIFEDFNAEMLNAGWTAPSASDLYDTNAGKFTLGSTPYTDGDRVNHPAVNVVHPSGFVPSLQIASDDIIDERLVVRAYTGNASSGSMMGNVFLYTLDQKMTGLDTGTRKVLAIGPVMKYQEQGRGDGKLNTKITPLYSMDVSDPPADYTAGPSTTFYYQNITVPVLNKLDNADLDNGVLEVGYYVVWDSTAMDPDAGGVPHGANLRFYRNATVFTEEEDALLHVSYQNAWLPTVASHELARLPNSGSFDSLYINHLEVTSNSSALFTSGMHILNYDVASPTNDGHDHNTMDSGLFVVTEGSTADNTNNLVVDKFAAMYYDANTKEWRITKGSNGVAEVGGTEATWVTDSGTTIETDDSDGRPTSGLRGTRVDSDQNSSERILTESDISDFITASSVSSNYATASSLSALSTTVSGLPTSISELDDVSVVAASLSNGQYLKWNNTEWVAGSAEDFTTGVTSINNTLTGAVTLTSDNITQGSSNLYYTDSRVESYVTASTTTGIATKSYVDSQVASLVDSAPGTLDTLNELAAAINDDASFSTTVTNNIATKAPLSTTIGSGTGIVTAGSLGSGVTVSLGTVTSDVGTFGSATKVPQLTVDTYGRVTAATLVDVHNFDGAYSSLTGAPTLFDGAYSSLTGAPTLFDGSYNSLSDAPTLSSVATSGAYADLTGTPTLFDGAYSSLIGAPALASVATSGNYSDLTGAPTLSNVATSGSYADLTGAPTLFDGAYSSLTGAPTLFDGAYSSLTGKPTLFDGAYASLTGAPTLSSVATSGAYADLSGTPTLFDGAYSSLTGAPTLSAVATSGAYTDLAGTPDLSGYATQDYVATQVGNIINSAPTLLNTLDELAAALNDDANFATTVTASIGTKQDALTAGDNVSITTGSTISVDLSSYATADTIASTYLTQANAATTYAAATSTASSITALGGRIDDVEDFTVSIAGNTISIDGGIIAASTLSASLTNAMREDLSIDSLATAASLNAVKATVDGRVNVTATGTGLTISGGTLSTTVDLSTLATAATLTNYVLTSAGNTAYANATTTASSISSLSGRLDDIEGDYLTSGSTLTGANVSGNIGGQAGSVSSLSGHSITLAGNTISLANGSITAASLSDSLKTEMSTDLGISSLATGTALTAVSARVTDIETDYLTSATTLSSSNLNNSSVSLGGLSVSLGGSITAASLSDALKTEMSTDLGISSLATSATLTSGLATKQDTLTQGSNISITENTIAVDTSLSNAVSANTNKVGFTNALARGAISATGDLSYAQNTGVISYTSQWAASSGKITTDNVVLVPGHVVEVFDMGADLTNQPDFTLDAGTIAGSVDRIVDCGILDQRRLF